jgi:hypothetical protein
MGYLFSFQALLRDGYRCTLTGIYDFDSCKNHPSSSCRRKHDQVKHSMRAHIFRVGARWRKGDFLPFFHVSCDASSVQLQ